MNYSSVLHGITPYIIEFSVDLYNEIEQPSISFSIYSAIVSNTVDGILSNEVPSTYYSKDVLITLFKPDSTNTNNQDKSITDVQFITDFDNLALGLSKQIITSTKNFDTGVIEDIFSFTTVTPDVYSSLSDTNFFYSECVNGIFDIHLLDNPNNNIDGVTKQIDFESITAYQFEINIGKLLLDEVASKTYTFNFITSKKTASTDVVYNTYPNNVMTSFNSLDYLKDIDSVLDILTNVNYEFVPVDEPTSIIQQDINGTLESLYIKQYLSEYTNYFNTINDENIRRNTLDNVTKKQIADLKKILLKNSNLVNSSFKGNKKGMSIIFNIFCQAVGQYLLNLEPSPSLQNFVYRITTSLPKEYWVGDIKNIIHPYSWKDEYVYVDITSSEKNLWYEINAKLPKEIALSYLDISNKERYHLYPSIFDLSVFEDYHSKHKFNFNANEYTADTSGYNDAALIYELSDPLLFDVGIAIGDDGLDVHAEYLKTGIALQYEFSLSIHGVAYQTIISYTPYINLTLPTINDEFDITVSLINKDFYSLVGTQNISLGIVDSITSFDRNDISNIMFLYSFPQYKWEVKDLNGNIINTISGTDNFIDGSSYIGNNIYLTVMYDDGFQRPLNTFINLVDVVGNLTVGENFIIQ